MVNEEKLVSIDDASPELKSTAELFGWIIYDIHDRAPAINTMEISATAEDPLSPRIVLNKGEQNEFTISRRIGSNSQPVWVLSEHGETIEGSFAAVRHLTFLAGQAYQYITESSYTKIRILVDIPEIPPGESFFYELRVDSDAYEAVAASKPEKN
jgi:hypothetical protein